MKKLIIFSLLLIIILSACTPKPQVQPNSNMDATVALQVAVAQTVAVARTQTAIAIQNAVSATPSLTSTSTFTATPESVYMTILEDTNCRAGANSAFALVQLLKNGTQVRIVAVNPDGDTFLVELPDDTKTRCWVWSKHTTIEGETNILPVYTPERTPTPTRTPTPAFSYSVTFEGKGFCSSDGYYYLRFKVKNTGGSPLQYVYIAMEDITAAVSTSYWSNNNFIDYSGCSVSNSQSGLGSGQKAVVAAVYPGQFTFDPAGHDVAVTFMACSAANMAGTCITQKFSVTP